jgi:hypothetical protein
MFGLQIINTTQAQAWITGQLSWIGDNIVPIIAIVGAVWGLHLALNLFAKSLPYYGGSLTATVSNYRWRNHDRED